MSGQTIVDYNIRLHYFDQVIHGEIDKDGRYLIGPLSKAHDYTVVAEAPGYRRFTSHNPMYTEDSPFAIQTQIFDAYLYPEDLESPRATIAVLLSDSRESATGTVRLRPVSGSSLFDEPTETPASVGRQLWSNDEDILSGTVLSEVQDGKAEIEAGRLIYGVTYDVSVLGVPGYQTQTGGQFTAGLDEYISVVVTPLGISELGLVLSTADLGPSEDDTLHLVFNQAIELDPGLSMNDYAELLDDAFSIVTEDDDADGELNSLRVDESATVRERGVSFSIQDNTLSISWSGELETRDGDDRITALDFGGLGGLVIRPVEDPRKAVALDSLVGDTSVQLRRAQ